MRTRRAFALAAIAAALATPALAASGAATGAVVTATNFQWSPSSLTVLAGEPVTFANGGGFHTWERDDGTDSCGLPCTRAFAPGTVAYHCGVHPGMRGVLRVASGAAPDLAVTAADGATGDARSTSVRWRVENVGLTATPASEVRLLRREGAAWVEVARAALDPLPPGGAREGDLAWGDGALRVGSFDVRVEADPGGLVAADPNRADNVRDGQASFVVALPTGVEV